VVTKAALLEEVRRLWKVPEGPTRAAEPRSWGPVTLALVEPQPTIGRKAVRAAWLAAREDITRPARGWGGHRAEAEMPRESD
jgi:hypothetical protein